MTSQSGTKKMPRNSTTNTNNDAGPQVEAVRVRLSKDILQDLQTERGSKIISYIVSTRQGTNYQIADDAVRIIYDHLKSLNIRKSDKVDLILHSFGGVGTVPWKLTNLIREFSDNFEVLVPYKAYSAATLIALGANKVIMHPMAELGPIDPQVGNEFNPINPQGQPIGINVEDVASYISFIKEFAGITHEDQLIQAINTLTEKVHPLALGNVHRFYSQSRMMAKKLLKLHMDAKEEHTITDIVETLTSKLFFHGHPINRREARTLGLKVEDPTREVETLMWELYLSYEKEMEMQTPFIPQQILNNSGRDMIENLNVIGAIIESQNLKSSHLTKFKIARPPLPPNAPIPLQIQASVDALAIPTSSQWENNH